MNIKAINAQIIVDKSLLRLPFIQGFDFYLHLFLFLDIHALVVDANGHDLLFALPIFHFGRPIHRGLYKLFLVFGTSPEQLRIVKRNQFLTVLLIFEHFLWGKLKHVLEQMVLNLPWHILIF
jgi:hypothetical protein